MLLSINEIIGDKRIVNIEEIQSVERISNEKYILKIDDGSSAVIEGHSDSVGWYSFEDESIVLECGRNNPVYVTGKEFDKLRKFVDKLEVYENLKMVSVQRWKRSMLFVIVPVDVNLESERDYNRAHRSGNVLYASTDETYAAKFLNRYGDFQFKKSPEGATIITDELFETFKDHQFPFFIDKPLYKIGDRLVYESYTCYNGYDGTCRCISHPRKEWRDFKSNKIIFAIK